MYKDILIAILSAVIAVLYVPGLSDSEKIGLAVGMATCVFMFLLFLEDTAEKIKRRRRIARQIRRLREMRPGGKP